MGGDGCRGLHAGVRTPATVRKWVRQAQIDAGARPGLPSEESDQIRRLKRENFELRRANEILQTASTAAELDRHSGSPTATSRMTGRPTPPGDPTCHYWQ